MSTSSLSRNTSLGLAAVGALLVVAFFMPWISLAGASASGWEVARKVDGWYFVVPGLGLVLAAAAATRSSAARSAALLTGAVILGAVVYQVIGAADLASWLVVGGGVVALAGAADERRALRAAGGALALVGFFAPWSDGSLWHALRGDDDLVRALLGYTKLALWAIPVGAVLGLGATVAAGKVGRTLAVVAGAAIIGGLVWTVGSVANAVLGWGAWATLALGAVALVGGLLARRQ
ncbi:MAG: hypothetical protein KBG28_30990 [Kofleriaceae bacterium]|jgi:hypothetical protein|nr:hypothetical protein [Kofleriaceae bacterium]MBP6838883.1 hypothetical protein [Kofleriaceae bacterium]MBP9208436.1 hypothetical protein [Kofleriaceae bacterium]